MTTIIITILICLTALAIVHSLTTRTIRIEKKEHITRETFTRPLTDEEKSILSSGVDDLEKEEEVKSMAEVIQDIGNVIATQLIEEEEGKQKRKKDKDLGD